MKRASLPFIGLLICFELFTLQMFAGTVQSGPVAICNAFVDLFLDAYGNATLSISDVDRGSFDNEGPVSLSLSRTSFDCSDLGASVSVLLTVTDSDLNTNVCESHITVKDAMAPTMVCYADITVTLDASGKYELSPSHLEAGSVDNCGVITFSLSKSKLDCGDGIETRVLLHGEDNSGNANSCWTTFHMTDADCDNVADGCDICPGGDDSVDNNHDDLPDCAQQLSAAEYSDDWICDNKPGKEKVLVCDKGRTKCVKISKLGRHLSNGNYIGPCYQCAEALKVNDDERKKTREQFDIVIFPNPTSGYIHINLPVENAIERLELLDLTGRRVHVVDTASEPSTDLDLSDLGLPHGLYFIRGHGTNGVLIRQVLYTK
jgi:hypothetical protein